MRRIKPRKKDRAESGVDPTGDMAGAPEPQHSLGFAEGWRLEPELAPFGPLTLVVSGADARAIAAYPRQFSNTYSGRFPQRVASLRAPAPIVRP